MASDLILNLTDADFHETVQNSDTPILVDFWAAWCGPCRMVAPILEDLAGELNGKLKIAKLNIDDHPKAAQEFGVMSIPTMLVFKGGKVAKTLVGAMPKQNLLDQLSDVL